jgi:hypothetical protein
MELYIAISLEKLRDIENIKDLEIEEAKAALEQYSNFSACRSYMYPGQDKLYLNKDNAVQQTSWPCLLVTVELSEEEFENVINSDPENNYHYFSKYKIEIIKAE